MDAETRHADAPTRDAARGVARDVTDAETARRAAMPPKKTFTVATKEDLELRRKYELLRQKKEARARREEAKAREDARVNGARMRAASGARGDARGTTREGAESSGRGRDGGGGRGGRGGRARTRDAPRECRDFDDDVPAPARAKRRTTATGSGATRREGRAEDVVVLETSDGFEDYAEDYDDDDDEGALGVRTLELADQGRGANVKSCEFVQACVDLAGCPKPTLPEIAVIGRSNVGKSSLVNMLTNRKSLAKTSKNPGKTQTINHYRMTTGDGKFYLVDLPGYGYANAPEDLREKWAAFTREYLIKRESLITVLLLIDSTVKPQRLDLECLDWLGEAGVPVTVVFTKVDKRKKVGAGKRANPAENVEEFCREVSEYWDELPPMLYTSSVNGEGKREVLNHIATLRQFFKKPLKEEVLAAVAPAAAASPIVADARVDAFADDEPEDDWN